MTDKERLEEIKAQYHLLTRNGYDLGAWDESFSWLIEQAERVQELEEEYKVRQVEYLEEHIDRLEEQNKRYREALRKIIKEGENGEYSHYTAQRALEEKTDE